MSDEVRTTSSTGGQKGVKPARFDLIPADSLWELAEHYGKGAAKYPADGGPDNWRRGYEWSKSFGAMMRHAVLALGGEDVDAETGSKHLTAVAWHALTLVHWMNSPAMQHFDDRQVRLEQVATDLPVPVSQAHRELMAHFGIELTQTPVPAGAAQTPPRDGLKV